MKHFKIWAWAVGATLIFASFAGCRGDQVGGGPVTPDPSPTAVTTGDQPSAGDPVTSAPADPAAPATQDPAAKTPSATAPPTTTPPTASTKPPANPGGRVLRIRVSKGDVYRYQMATKMVGGQGAGAAMTMDATVRMAVQDVKGKEVTMKMTFEKIEMPMLTQAPPEQRKQFEDMFKKLAIVYVLDDQGRTVSVRAEGGPPGSESVFGSLGASGASAALPDGPVKVGDTYTSEQKVNNETVKATYKVLAFERKNGVEAVKMEMANSFRNTSQTMFVWIELATGMMVAAEGDMAIPAAQGGGSIRTTMSRI